MAYSLAQHEYQIYENGVWSASRQINMTQLPDGRHRISGLVGSYATGHVRVRVMAIGGNPPSDWLYNNVPFTGTMPANQLPVANAGADNSLTLPTNSVVLNGSGTDADGTIAGYTWKQESGPSTATFSSKTIAKPTVSGLVAGKYVFSLVVTDNQGAVSALDLVEITVAGEQIQYTDRVNVVMAGNSIVFGYGASTNYPAEMDARLPSNFTITNIGQSGWNMTQINGQRGLIDSLFDATPGATNVLMLQEGINSFEQGQSLNDFWALYNDFLAYFRAKGWKVVAVTPTPFNFYENGTPAIQQELISRMRAAKATLYDGLLDWSPNPHVGYFTPYNSAAFNEWFPDGLHPSTKAQQLMGHMAYDMMRLLFDQVPLPDQTGYGNEGTSGKAYSWIQPYNVVTYQNLVYGKPGIGQRDNHVYGSAYFLQGTGLRGVVEFSMNARTGGFVGLSELSGNLLSGQQFTAAQVDGHNFNMWDGMTNKGIVDSWGAWVRVRLEIYSDKVLWFKDGELFYTYNAAPNFPCRFSIIPDGTGFEAAYYDCRYELPAPPPPPQSGDTLLNQDTRFDLNGPWQRGSTALPQYYYSTTGFFLNEGDSGYAELVFVGTGVELAGPHFDAGVGVVTNMDVLVDGQLKTTLVVPADANPGTKEVLYTLTGLPAGTHTLRLQSKATGFTIIDRIRIL